jgi:hypothetical protein
MTLCLLLNILLFIIEGLGRIRFVTNYVVATVYLYRVFSSTFTYIRTFIITRVKVLSYEGNNYKSAITA